MRTRIFLLALSVACLLGFSWDFDADPGGSGGGHIIEDDENGVLTNRPTLSFTGDGITCSDADPKTVCNVPVGAFTLTITEFPTDGPDHTGASDITFGPGFDLVVNGVSAEIDLDFTEQDNVTWGDQAADPLATITHTFDVTGTVDPQMIYSDDAIRTNVRRMYLDADADDDGYPDHDAGYHIYGGTDVDDGDNAYFMWEGPPAPYGAKLLIGSATDVEIQLDMNQDSYGGDGTFTIQTGQDTGEVTYWSLAVSNSSQTAQINADVSTYTFQPALSDAGAGEPGAWEAPILRFREDQDEGADMWGMTAPALDATVTCTLNTDGDWQDDCIANILTIDGSTQKAWTFGDGTNDLTLVFDAATGSDPTFTIINGILNISSGGFQVAGSAVCTGEGGCSLSDGSGDSPEITWTPETASPWGMYADEAADRIALYANNSGQEYFRVYNYGTGTAGIEVELTNTVYTPVVAGNLTTQNAVLARTTTDQLLQQYASLVWNVTAATCGGTDGEAGALTVNSSNEIICSVDGGASSLTLAGASGDVQYNNGAADLGAESAFNWTPATDTLTLGDNSRDALIIFDPVGAANPTLTASNNVLNLSTGELQVGGVPVCSGATNCTLWDDTTNSPELGFQPETGTTWKIYASDAGDLDLLEVYVSEADDQTVRIHNYGAGLASLEVETTADAWTKVLTGALTTQNAVVARTTTDNLLQQYASLTWNVTAATCGGGDGDSGALTVNSSNEIICSPDDTGSGARLDQITGATSSNNIDHAQNSQVWTWTQATDANLNAFILQFDLDIVTDTTNQQLLVLNRADSTNDTTLEALLVLQNGDTDSGTITNAIAVASAGAPITTGLNLANQFITNAIAVYDSGIVYLTGAELALLDGITAALVDTDDLAAWAGSSNVVTVGPLTGGSTGAGFTVALDTATITGTLADARLPSSMADKAFTGSMNIPNGASPTLDATGEFAIDDTGLNAPALVFENDGTEYAIGAEHHMCGTLESLVDTDDDVPFDGFREASTITAVGCTVRGTTQSANVTFSDGTNTVKAIDCGTTAATMTYDGASLTNTAYSAGEVIEFDTNTAANVDWAQFCVAYTVDRA